jgi:predicted amino acid-binding ACT domain protein
MKKVVISVLGQDRPGIIAAVSGILFEQGCNIENVDQTILQSEFSGIFIAGIPVEMEFETLHKKLIDGVKGMGLNIFIKPWGSIFSTAPVMTRSVSRIIFSARLRHWLPNWWQSVTRWVKNMASPWSINASEIIKKTAYKVTRVGELIGREVAEILNIRFGVVDLSLAPIHSLNN